MGDKMQKTSEVHTGLYLFSICNTDSQTWHSRILFLGYCFFTNSQMW
uniref:Uncharacterized protein n=1 Tax=Arundo donax TaxID=35708 RepID=A0A0A8XWJ7_ARUDO